MQKYLHAKLLERNTCSKWWDTLLNKLSFRTLIFCSKVPSKCRICRFRDPYFKHFTGGLYTPGHPTNVTKMWRHFWLTPGTSLVPISGYHFSYPLEFPTVVHPLLGITGALNTPSPGNCKVPQQRVAADKNWNSPLHTLQYCNWTIYIFSFLHTGHRFFQFFTQRNAFVCITDLVMHFC